MPAVTYSNPQVIAWKVSGEPIFSAHGGHTVFLEGGEFVACLTCAPKPRTDGCFY